MNELTKKNERNCQLENSINLLQQQAKEDQTMIAKLTQQRKNHDFEYAKLMTNKKPTPDGNRRNKKIT